MTREKKTTTTRTIITIDKKRRTFMSALIIGADRLGKIPMFLEGRGISEYIHWDGRKKGMRKSTG